MRDLSFFNTASDPDVTAVGACGSERDCPQEDWSSRPCRARHLCRRRFLDSHGHRPDGPEDRPVQNVDGYFHGKYGPGFLVGVNSARTGRATLPGYDTLTGLGTPNGSYFINALRSGR
jgi:hypothetical protein